MKKAIKQKLLNLVTIDPKDFCIRTHLDQRHIDILKYIKKDLFLQFVNQEISQIEISTASGATYFEDQLNNANNVDEFINVIENNGFDIDLEMIENLKNNFISLKKKIQNHYISEMKTSKKIFISLNRIAKQYYNDTAIWPLHIAFQFIKGKISDETAIKAPIILQKVEIIEEGSKLYLRRIEDEPIVNEKIRVILNKEYPNHLSSNEFFKPFTLQETINKFNSMVGYDIEFNESIIENFINEDSKKILSSYPLLRIESSTILGFFEPGGSALKQDLEQIIEQDIDPFDSQSNSTNKSSEYYQEKTIKSPDLLVINHPLNIFQKYAVLSALEQSTLIYGPPGTGKSEVISNIVSNALIKGKSVLMVSEKKAALDVLTNRIKSLSQFMLYLCENRERDKFYKKINDLNILLGTQWYREPSRYTKNAQIEPLKMDSSELMFYNNYKEWYNELFKLVQKHWKIEDYQDKIFDLDYVKYQNLKNELGEQICSEWLSNIFIEGIGNTIIYEKIQQLLVEYNITKIEDFFNEYLKYKKFVKKYKFAETMSSNEINKYIKKIKQKIISNIKIVENFLLGGKKINSLFELFFIFKDKYENTKIYQEFLDKNQKQKEVFLDWIDDYLLFKKSLFSKKPEWKNINKDELNSIAKDCFDFNEKYKKEISKFDWINFIEENNKKIPLFIEKYNSSLSNLSDAEIVLAEFIHNKRIINEVDECELPLKTVKNLSKNANEVLMLFKDYLEKENSLNHDFILDFIKFKDFFSYDDEFLNDLMKIRDVFLPKNTNILKEYSWISQPYIKDLYLNNYTIFDLELVSSIMQHISSPINEEQFNKLKMISLWNDIVKEVPMFMEIKGINLQDIITQLRREEIRSTSIVEELIFKKYINSLRNYLIKLPKDERDEIANIFRIASSNIQPPITQFVQKYYFALKKLFPVWVARPDNVADMIPFSENEFYYGIFDEASQMSLERSYPLVYRTKIKIVSGDDKQLKPTSFFASKLNDNEYDLDDFDAVESLLERAKVSWWNEFHLKNHYRSNSKELIEFSNKFIYNNNLEIATKCGIFEKGIEVIDVNGIWNQVNKEEASKILEILIENHLKYEKILIITFNSKQSQLLENMLIERNSSLDESLQEKIEKNNVIITNLENVQGNEGDLVILSISYGKNSDGVIRSNFGPLVAKGGSNRLNVAITRAKEKMIVVKSLNGNDIKISNPNNKNAIIFKKFIEYLDIIKNNFTIDNLNQEMVDVNEINEGTQEIEVIQAQTQEINSLDFSKPIVKIIYADLIKSLSSKYEIKVNFVVGSKNIDLLILNKKDQSVVKALLIEEWKTNRTTKEMIEDIDRQYFLEDRGYSTFKIKEYEWHIDKIKLIDKIKQSLTNKYSSNLDYIIWQNER